MYWLPVRPIPSGRFLTTSLHSSTLLGRLLYAQDALPVILRHPFGLGYRSYTYMQGSFPDRRLFRADGT